MTPGIDEAPSPPPGRASRLQEWVDVFRYSELTGLVRSVRLPALIQYALRPPPGDAGPPTPAGPGTRRAGHARFTQPLGLADIVRLRDSTPEAGVAAGDNEGGDEHRLLLSGSQFVEIFGVSANFPFVGTIHICDDGCWPKTVYHREDWDGVHKRFIFKKGKWLSRYAGTGHSSCFEFQDKLVLTGPSRCISPYGGIAVVLGIPTKKKKDHEYLKLSWNTEEDVSMHGKPRTRTIVTKRGRVHVTCAVVNNAADAYVELMLRLPCEAALCAKVHGHITARIHTFSIGCTLFSKDADEAVDVSVSRDSLLQGHSDDHEFCQPIVLPLDRSVLVVPVRGCVHVKGELVFNGSNVVPVDHSLRIEREIIQSQWVQDNYCYTSVHVMIRDY